MGVRGRLGAVVGEVLCLLVHERVAEQRRRRSTLNRPQDVGEVEPGSGGQMKVLAAPLEVQLVLDRLRREHEISCRRHFCSAFL
eukprot:983766-Prymnesium_polylepis.2